MRGKRLVVGDTRVPGITGRDLVSRKAWMSSCGGVNVGRMVNGMMQKRKIACSLFTHVA